MTDEQSSYQRQNVSWSGASEKVDVAPGVSFTKAPVTETINALTIWDAARPRGWRALVHPLRWWRGKPVTIKFNP